jgi:hypothetical protein
MQELFPLDELSLTSETSEDSSAAATPEPSAWEESSSEHSAEPWFKGLARRMAQEASTPSEESSGAATPEPSAWEESSSEHSAEPWFKGLARRMAQEASTGVTFPIEESSGEVSGMPSDDRELSTTELSTESSDPAVPTGLARKLLWQPLA